MFHASASDDSDTEHDVRLCRLTQRRLSDSEQHVTIQESRGSDTHSSSATAPAYLQSPVTHPTAPVPSYEAEGEVEKGPPGNAVSPMAALSLSEGGVPHSDERHKKAEQQEDITSSTLTLRAHAAAQSSEAEPPSIGGVSGEADGQAGATTSPTEILDDEEEVEAARMEGGCDPRPSAKVPPPPSSFLSVG